MLGCKLQQRSLYLHLGDPTRFATLARTPESAQSLRLRAEHFMCFQQKAHRIEWTSE